MNLLKLNTTTVNNVLTVSSMELVRAINVLRAEDNQSELRHDNFVAKVLKELGEKDALNFQGIYLDVYSREKPCYYLPQRESLIMAASESRVVRAKLVDALMDAMKFIEDSGLAEEFRKFAKQAEEDRYIMLELIKDRTAARDTALDANGKLSDKLNPYKALPAGFYTLAQIKEDRKWKSCPSTLRKLLDAYGFRNYVGDIKRKYDLHSTVNAINEIILMSGRIGEGRMNFAGINYDWYAIKPRN